VGQPCPAGSVAPPAVAESVTWPSGTSPDGAPMWEAASGRRQKGKRGLAAPRHFVALWFLPYGRIARDSLHLASGTAGPVAR
jgi:hypothetical protein